MVFTLLFPFLFFITFAFSSIADAGQSEAGTIPTYVPPYKGEGYTPKPYQGGPLILTNVRLDQEDWAGRTMQGSKLSNLTCLRCDFSGIDLSGSVLSNVIFEQSNLEHANLSRANLSNVQFRGGSVNGMIVQDAMLSKVGFYNTVTMLDVDLTTAKLSNVDYKNAITGFVPEGYVYDYEYREKPRGKRYRNFNCSSKTDANDSLCY